MTKAIILSIQSQHAFNILNGNKTLELRSWIPKGYVGWVYVYVTKGKPYLIDFREESMMEQKYELFHKKKNVLGILKNKVVNSKVAFRFLFDEYDTYYWNEYQGQYRLISKDKERFVSAIMSYDELCLNEKQVNDYGNEKHLLYTWHIKHLEIFDKPMELKNFHKLSVGKETSAYIRLDKAPQSWQYIYVKGESK